MLIASKTNKFKGEIMIKPERLRKGDKVVIVSLSSGMLGEDWAIHKLDIAKERLTKDFGLEVVVMPNALKGIDYLNKHPEARAKDLMDAFKDKSIKAIFNAIGGDDTIRLLPYIDFDVIKNNPKILTGFSDTTTNHFMMYKAGVVSYYGASIMNNFAEYIKINDYTKNAIIDTLFEPKDRLEIKPALICSYEKDKVWWLPENINKERKYYKDNKGYEILQGHGKVTGELLGGCADVFIELLNTKLWPSLDEWKGKILFLETSEENMPDFFLLWLLRNLQAQGILNVINGIIVGKPAFPAAYEKYKKIYKQVVCEEANLPNLPIIYNVNFGHAEPIGIIPIGIKCELDCDNKTITLLETATK